MVQALHVQNNVTCENKTRKLLPDINADERKSNEYGSQSDTHTETSNGNVKVAFVNSGVDVAFVHQDIEGSAAHGY